MTKTRKKKPVLKRINKKNPVITCCPVCETPYEIVKTGKTYPNCICHLICDLCGGRIAHHTLGEDKRFPKLCGDWCEKCGPFVD